jgi:hypothetical protein
MKIGVISGFLSFINNKNVHFLYAYKIGLLGYRIDRYIR